MGKSTGGHFFKITPIIQIMPIYLKNFRNASSKRVLIISPKMCYIYFVDLYFTAFNIDFFTFVWRQLSPNVTLVLKNLTVSALLSETLLGRNKKTTNTKKMGKINFQ